MLLAWSCGDEERSPGRFGEITSAVVIVNPVINEDTVMKETFDPFTGGGGGVRR